MGDLSDLGARERQIMDIVLRLGRATAQQVRAECPNAPTYSTVRAILRVLEDKGFLHHEQDGLRYVYFSSVPKEMTQREALSHLVDVYFEGSAAAAAAALLELPARRTDAAQFERLRKLIALRSTAKKRGET
jgi:predicted transcriptional regulator